jgi:hypothetical protein
MDGEGIINIVSFHLEMAFFPMSRVLRELSACDVPHVRLGVNPCAALLIEKIAHFQIGNKLVPSLQIILFSDGH